MDWQFTWIRGWDEVWDPDRLQPWRAAFADDANASVTPFAHPDVMRAWTITAGEREFDPFFVEAAHPDGRKAQMHFVRPRPRARQGWVRRLVPMGERVFDYHDPLVTAPSGVAPVLDDGFWAALREELDARPARWFDLVHIPRLRQTCLGDALPGPVTEVAPWVNLEPYADLDAYLAARSRKMRRSIRRAERKLRAEGELAFTVHPRDDGQAVQAFLPKLVEAKRQKFGARFDAGFFSAFLTALVDEALGSGVVYCSSTSLDGNAINWQVGFWHDGVLYRYMSAADPDFSHVSLGNLHTSWTIQWGLQFGAQACDFMRGAEPYKYSWTDGAEQAMRDFKHAGRAPSSLVRRGISGGLRRLRRGR